MKKGLLFGLLLFFVFPVFSFALPANEYIPETVGAGKPELHIKPDGTLVLKSGKVDQIAGSTLYIGIKWGTLQMRFTMKTDSRTAVTKRYGGTVSVAQISVGDYIDVEGEFFEGSDFFGVQALKVKDWSLQEEAGTYSGVITEVTPDQRFMLRTPQNQTITVGLSTSSALSIKKGSISVPFGRLQKGETVLRASGVYDYARNVLTADTISVYQGKTEFLPRNFEGTLKQMSAPTIPATIVVTVSGKDYTVRISEKTPLLKKNKNTAQLARFVVGDTIRFYGAVREEEKTLQDALVVDAEVVRNLSL